MSVKLEFPFVEVDLFSVAFGGIPNYEQVVQACPDEFRRGSFRNPWCQVFSHMFFKGVKSEELSLFHFKTQDPNIAEAQMLYLRTWMGSYEPRHEVKEAVCGWLLSLMLEDVPAFK